MFRYEDFNEVKMISTFENDGVIEICLTGEESKVFDYMITRYSNKDVGEIAASDGLVLIFNFLANLSSVYKMCFVYRKLCFFDNVFFSQKPIEFKKTENETEYTYTCKKVLRAASSA